MRQPTPCDCLDVRLARCQSVQSLDADIGDGGNSLSMRWVKFGTNGSMNRAEATGRGWH